MVGRRERESERVMMEGDGGRKKGQEKEDQEEREGEGNVVEEREG